MNGFAPQVDGAISYPAWTVVHVEHKSAPGGPQSAVHAKRESTCSPIVILSRVAVKNLPQFHKTPSLYSGQALRLRLRVTQETTSPGHGSPGTDAARESIPWLKRASRLKPTGDWQQPPSGGLLFQPGIEIPGRLKGKRRRPRSREC
ncbi:MAG: hypothetical protein H5T68_01850 [Chloroflexi bacterium]|nr:hypothetical protein [Chloroflexota bacterium]